MERGKPSITRPRGDRTCMKPLSLFVLSALALVFTSCASDSRGHADDRPFNVQTNRYETANQAGGTEVGRQTQR
jgi:hypothetical protein